MTRSHGHFEEFEDHTLLKHAVLRAYLFMWAFKLLQRPGAADRVIFVDSFAGPGKDNAGHPGSPTIACQVAQQVRGALAARPRLMSARMVVVAVEPKRAYYHALVEQLKPFLEQEGDYVHTMLGTASDHVDAIAERATDRPTLYFLDPFGVEGLDAAKYPKMLAGPQNEIFALFSDMGAARLRGVVHASDEDLESQLANLHWNPSLFPEMDVVDERGIYAEEGRRQEARDRTEPAARGAITRALGDDSWVTELAELDSDAVREELLKRFVAKLIDSGALYVQVIPMRDSAGYRKYCLVHASKSRKAWTTMKTAVSEGLNRPDLSEVMRDRIRQDLRQPIDLVIGWLTKRFGGQEVHWTSKKGADEGTVKRSLLDETVVFDFQCSEIKDELRAHGWLARRRAGEFCTLPSVSSDT
jgi:three-Cys-motif partner protein